MRKIKNFFARGLIFCPSRDLPLEGQKFSHLNFDNRIHIHQIRYPHFYPETKEIVSPKLFGFNKKTHSGRFLIYLPVSAVLSLICLIF